MIKKLASVLLVGLMITLVGCNSVATAQTSVSPTQGDSTTYQYSANPRFIIVSNEKVDDGTVNGILISTLVDKETKVMYLKTEKFQSGYGLALQVLLDKDGKPMIYSGNTK